MTRREFLAAAAMGTAALGGGCSSFDSHRVETIDCHTHFYDPTRPGGVPWPGKNDTQLYRRVLPDDYKRLAVPLGITGTVVVEASAWLEDNQWILDLAADEPFIRGFVGHLNPGDAEFAKQVKRFARNPLFRGIRVSFSDVPKLSDEAKLRDLRVLAEHDLSLDLNGGVDSLSTVELVAKSVSNLRIIINHVANVRIDGKEPPSQWKEGMLRAAACPNVFCKVSGLVEGSGRRGGAPTQAGFYLPILDHVWGCFGEDRVVYGSNWPVSELFAEFGTVHAIVSGYFAGKGTHATRKFFCDNSRNFYKWVRR